MPCLLDCQVAVVFALHRLTPKPAKLWPASAGPSAAAKKPIDGWTTSAMHEASLAMTARAPGNWLSGVTPVHRTGRGVALRKRTCQSAELARPAQDLTP